MRQPIRVGLKKDTAIVQAGAVIVRLFLHGKADKRSFPVSERSAAAVAGQKVPLFGAANCAGSPADWLLLPCWIVARCRLQQILGGPRSGAAPGLAPAEGNFARDKASLSRCNLNVSRQIALSWAVKPPFNPVQTTLS